MILSPPVHSVERHFASLLRNRKASRSSQALRAYRTSWLHVVNSRCSPATTISCTFRLRLSSIQTSLVTFCTRSNVWLYVWLGSTIQWRKFQEDSRDYMEQRKNGMASKILSKIAGKKHPRRITQPNHQRPKMERVQRHTSHGGTPDCSEHTSELCQTYPEIDIGRYARAHYY